MAQVKKIDFKKCARFYFNKDYDSFIVGVWSQNKSGIHYEVTALPMIKDFSTSVDTFWQSIEASAFKDEDVKEKKSTDWPAFKVSRFKTLKAFKREYKNIWVIAFNSSNILYDCMIYISEEINYSVHATINPLAPLEEKMRVFRFLMDKAWKTNH